jgi:quinol monooxygenase YgiN
MANSPIILNVHTQAVAGREADLSGAFRSLIAPTRQEPGCLVYEFHVDAEDPGKSMFYEKFKDQAALDSHLTSPHFLSFQNYLKAQGNLIASQTVTKWRSVE